MGPKHSLPRFFRATTVSLRFLLVVCLFSTVDAFLVASHGETRGIVKRQRIYTSISLSAKDDWETRLKNHDKSNPFATYSTFNEVHNRRKIMTAISTAALSGLFMPATDSALAYDREFPLDLDSTDAVIEPRRKPSDPALQNPSALELSSLDLGVGSLLWGGALWLLAGSRSNPLATPLANLLYNAQDEEWLQDRNDGLFAALPAPLLLLMALLFCAFGLGAHVLAITLSDGSIDSSLQLAGVLLIGAGSLELGRFASGEKRQTRSDFDRIIQLEGEFAEFAERRLRPGGNVHRSEVVKAFRRYYAKYRQADSEQNPLNDLEIEQLLKDWNEQNLRATRSAAGFYTGLQINTDADVFV